jgi:hypothetical protein
LIIQLSSQQFQTPQCHRELMLHPFT